MSLNLKGFSMRSTVHKQATAFKMTKWYNMEDISLLESQLKSLFLHVVRWESATLNRVVAVVKKNAKALGTRARN